MCVCVCVCVYVCVCVCVWGGGCRLCLLVCYPWMSLLLLLCCPCLFLDLEFYSLKQIQRIIRPRSYPLLCQFLMKIIKVITPVCTCVKTSAEDDDFQSLSKRDREGGRERGGRERESVCVCV